MQNLQRLSSLGSNAKSPQWQAHSGERLKAEYVLPLRWDDDTGLDESTRYLRRLSAWLDVTVEGGSGGRMHLLSRDVSTRRMVVR
jgi:hypothetical protein